MVTPVPNNQWEFKVEGPHAWAEYYYLIPEYRGDVELQDAADHLNAQHNKEFGLEDDTTEYDRRLMLDGLECDKVAKQYLLHLSYLISADAPNKTAPAQTQHIPLTEVMAEIDAWELDQAMEREYNNNF